MRFLQIQYNIVRETGFYHSSNEQKDKTHFVFILNCQCAAALVLGPGDPGAQESPLWAISSGNRLLELQGSCGKRDDFMCVSSSFSLLLFPHSLFLLPVFFLYCHSPHSAYLAKSYWNLSRSHTVIPSLTVPSLSPLN